MAVADYKDAIIAISRAKGIDPSFSAAIVYIESGGNPRAGLSAYRQNADGSWHTIKTFAQGVGLTQVIPVEAFGDWRGRPTVNQLLDPLFNLDYGISLLADNLSRCGTKEGAACAYFSGHCIPRGSSDPNISDFGYIQVAISTEQSFLEYNNEVLRVYTDQDIDNKVGALIKSIGGIGEQTMAQTKLLEALIPWIVMGTPAEQRARYIWAAAGKNWPA